MTITTKHVDFQRILIANRGEIACRVIATANQLGYDTIAIYSEADSNAPHVRMAHDSICIGPAPIADSYLNIDKTLTAAKETQADAIHPGYGFLSENSQFANACEQEGIVFIGPKVEAIELMGNKAESRRLMLKAGIPCIPGYEGKDQQDSTLIAMAKDIGYPLMIKAAAGGGGKGIRLVNSPHEMAEALALARSEALCSFASDQLIIEKAIINPRHVEIQIFADIYGNTIHLGERDCSIQRRHQKIIEEAPCPVMTPALRTQMGDAAITAAKSINYCGAGTVEFLLDSSNDCFYFLEMNTRLQVEHPVTELITGLDLVALQIQVAHGEALPLAQNDVNINGHAIEARLYTEDCNQDFLPASGDVDYWSHAQGEGIRVDSGIESGMSISPFYDPMVAKIIAWGNNRQQARLRLIKALSNSLLFGTITNREFLIQCLKHEAFSKGNTHTGFIHQYLGKNDISATSLDIAIGAVIDVNLDHQQAANASIYNRILLKNWCSAGSLMSLRNYTVTLGFKEQGSFEAKITQYPQEHYQIAVTSSSDTVTFDIKLISCVENKAVLEIDGSNHIHYYHRTHIGKLYTACTDKSICFSNKDDRLGLDPKQLDERMIVAPMHGVILDIQVAVGEKITAGRTLAVLEAMKMHHQVTAETDGIVEAINISVGEQIATGTIMFQLQHVSTPS